MDMVHQTTWVLVGTGCHIHLYVTHAHSGGEMAAGRIYAVGIEHDGALDAAARQTHAKEVESHQQVAGCHQIDVDKLSSVKTVLNSCASLIVIGTLLQITGTGTVVTSSGNDDASRSYQPL